MATSTLIISATGGNLYASASGNMGTGVTGSGTSSITLTANSTNGDGIDVGNPGNPKIVLQKDSDNNEITNCPILYVVWENGCHQDVLFDSTSTNRLATYRYNSTVVGYTQVQAYSGGTVTVSPASGASGASTSSPLNVAVDGYYYSHLGTGGNYDNIVNSNTLQGSYNHPAHTNNRDTSLGYDGKTQVSFKYSGDATLFIYIVWRGWGGASPESPGDIGILSGKKPIVNFVYPNSWSGGYNTIYNNFRLDLFAINGAGIRPSISSCYDTKNVKDDSCPDNASWIFFPETATTYEVKYYADDGTTLLRGKNDPHLTLGGKVRSGAGLAYYTQSEIYNYKSGTSGTPVIPSGYRLDGYYKKEYADGAEASTAWGTTLLTNNSAMGTVSTKNVAFKAAIVLDVVTITFNSNYPSGSSGSTSDRTRSWTIGSSQTLLSAPATPTRAGYTYEFAGWYTAASGGTKVGDAGAAYTVPSSNTPLYAHWTATTVKYTVTYNSNGGSAVSAQDYYVTTNLTLRAAPTRDGYTFGGWKCTSTSGGWSATTYTASQNVGTGHYANVTLTAQWSATSYVATFAPGSGTWSDNTTGSKTSNYTITQTLAAPATISRVGYTFAGWKVTSAGGNWAANTVYNNSPQTKLEGASGKYGKVTFTAQWNINSYTLTTAVNSATMGSATGGGSKNYNASCTVVATPNAGYEFVQWTFTGAKTDTSTTASTTFNMPAGNVTATATFRARTFTLSFVIATDNYPTSSDGDAGNVPSKPADRSITYQSAYGTLPGESTIHGDPDNWDEYFDEWKWDYSFDGWFTSASGGTRVTSSNIYTTVGNQTLYAHWVKERKAYSVVWKDWDGTVLATCDGGTGTDHYPKVPAGDVPVYPKTTPSRTGYTFLGWGPAAPSAIQQDSEYIAQYQVITYNITYHTAYTHSNPATYTVEDRIVLTNPTRTGYQFVRWTDNANATGENHIIPKGSTGNKNFWAWWVPVLSPFDPDPEKTPEEQEFFGIPVDIDPLYDYELKLSVAGDRGGMTNFVLPAAQGHYTTAGWENTIDKTIYGSQGLIEYLRANDVFTMDVWRAVIRHASAVLKVELNVYYNGTLIQAATPTLNTFKIGDQYKPIVFDAHFEEGMQSIYEMELFNESSARPRFIGNNKSCILCRLDATNYNSRNAEMLYGAVPTKFKVRLTSTQDSWMTDNLFSTISTDKVNQYITEANVETKQKIIYDDCDWIVVANEELFPSINQDIVATLKIKIFDTRHEG